MGCIGSRRLAQKTGGSAENLVTRVMTHGLRIVGKQKRRNRWQRVEIKREAAADCDPRIAYSHIAHITYVILFSFSPRSPHSLLRASANLSVAAKNTWRGASTESST